MGGAIAKSVYPLVIIYTNKKINRWMNIFHTEKKKISIGTTRAYTT